MRLTQPLVLVTLVFTALSAADRRPDGRFLRLATFNANFLFDGRPPEGNASFPWKGNPARARRHLEQVADILRVVDADILHISEVEDLATLERLRSALNDPTYRAYLVEGTDTFTRQNVGLLTRLDPLAPLLRTERLRTVPRLGLRQGVAKHYLATFDLGSFSLTVVGAHLLAFPDEPARAARRELQAEVLRDLAIEHGTGQGHLVAVIGDLNDFDPSVPDAAGRRSMTTVLDTLRRLDPTVGEDDLFNAALWLPRSLRFTVYHDHNANGIDDGLEERSMSDHILLPTRLLRTVMSVDVLAGYPPGRPSDHYPLRVVLDLGRLELFVRGDVNGDRVVDSGDLPALARVLLGGLPYCADAADLDDNGLLNLADLLCLSNALYLRGPPPPEPGPWLPGGDPTPDAMTCRG